MQVLPSTVDFDTLTVSEEEKPGPEQKLIKNIGAARVAQVGLR
jgi:hypothetical protein